MSPPFISRKGQSLQIKAITLSKFTPVSLKSYEWLRRSQFYDYDSLQGFAVKKQPSDILSGRYPNIPLNKPYNQRTQK